MSEEQQKEFERLTRQLIEWLCINGHPHQRIAITLTGAVLLEECVGFSTEEYLRD